MSEEKREKPTWPKVYTLLEPIEFAGETITEVKIRKPTGKDMRVVPTDPKTLDPLISFAARMAGLSSAEMDLLDARDVMGILDLVNDFLGGSLPAGSEP